ncbi:MAG: PD40 domain-containing protein [Bacteroidales bacterium]|nr:PD40 domain-containing protein [Bacteroidales bacterium]
MSSLKIYILFLLIILSKLVISQKNPDYSTSSKKAIKLYETALDYMDLGNYDMVIETCNSAIQKDTNFIEAFLLIADIYNTKGDLENEIITYKKVIKINPDFFPYAFYNLAFSEFKTGKYLEAKKDFQNFLDCEKIAFSTRIKAEKQIYKCNFAINSVNNPVLFNPVNLGDNINSKNDEYWPSLTADENTLVVTVLVKDSNNIMYPGQEDFYISHKINGKWEKVKDIGKPINTKGNEGAQSISADGQSYYFTACHRNDGRGACDLYFVQKNGNKWGEPINLRASINTRHSEKQPSISPDGRTLYFSSNRPGGKGKMDIWMCKKLNDDSWSTPVNLGDSINTEEDEISPFIHPDNLTLYFASNGLTGMGGYDIFISRKNTTNSWGKPENLGYPINTHKDEFGLIVNAMGNKAYYSSDKRKGYGKDIYEFDLHDRIRPLFVSYINGIVYNVKNNSKLKAKIKLISLDTINTVLEVNSDSISGEYLICLPIDNDYALNVSKRGYLFYSDYFSLKNVVDFIAPFSIDVPLQPIEIGKSTILKNIFFETDSYKLKPESKTELDKIIEFLKQNPEVKIEIGGHTDNVGTHQYNIELSKNRAKEVFNYIKSNCKYHDRVIFKGYGETQALSTNDTKEGRALNRRTEFKIIEK